MSQQEVGIKLKADTQDAIKSVKELERAMHGLEGIRKNGDDKEGFISENDVKRFKRLSREAESVYRDFLGQYDRMQREFNKKKSDLENAMKQNVDKTTMDNLQRQIQQLEAQRTALESQRTISENINSRVQQANGDIGGMRTDNSFSMFARNMGHHAVGGILGALSVGKLFGIARSGMSMINNEEAYGAQLGNRWNQYNGNYTQLRKDAMNNGLANGYKAMETMQTADIYTSQAGASRNTWANVDQIQKSARAMGLDPNQLASAGGSMAQLGALKDGEQRKFANLLAGAISKEGMAGRDKELVDAVTSVAQNSAQSQVSLSKGELNQIVGLETALGANIPGLKGQRGAQIINSMDSGIKGGDNRVDLLLGWGTKYQGVAGRAALDRQKSKGVTDPQNVKSIFNNLEKSTGGNKDLEQIYLEEIFGWSGDQAASILNNDKLMDTLKKGGLSKKEMDALGKKGSANITKKGEDYDNSKAGRRARVAAQWEKTKKAGGEVLDNIWYPAADMFTSMPTGVQWGAMGAGALGAGMFGGKLIKGASRGLSRLFSSNVSTAAEGGGMMSKAGEFLKGIGSKSLDAVKGVGSKAGALFEGLGGVKGVLGKVAMPLAVATSVYDVAKAKNKGKAISKNAGGLAGMWAGAEGGAMAGAALGTIVPGIGNVVGGVAGGLIGGIGGWFGGKKVGEGAYNLFKPTKASAAELSPEDLSKAAQERKKIQNQQIESKKQSTEQLRKENIKAEKDNLDKKSAVTDKEQKVKDEDRKNIDDLKKINGVGSSSVPGQGDDSGGGFWGNLWKGIKNFFGYGGGEGSGSGGGGGGSAPTKLSGSKNADKIWNFFAGKGMSSGAIAGILGNLKQENSTFDPTNPNGGIAQWAGSRKKELNAYAKKNGLNANTLEAQLGFMWHEMSSGKYVSTGKMNKMSAREAAKYFSDNYEKPGKPMINNRMSYADSYYNQYNGKGWSHKTDKAVTSSKTTHTVNVKVSGGIKGLTPENNRLVASSIAKNVSGSPINLMYQFQQGVGGNR